MKLRVRILHASLDPNATQALANSIGCHGTQSVATDMELATVELEAPMKVSWKDHKLELDV